MYTLSASLSIGLRNFISRAIDIVMDTETISAVMRELAQRRKASLSPERRSEIASIAGKASRGIPRPNAKGKPKPRKPLPSPASVDDTRS